MVGIYPQKMVKYLWINHLDQVELDPHFLQFGNRIDIDNQMPGFLRVSQGPLEKRKWSLVMVLSIWLADAVRG